MTGPKFEQPPVHPEGELATAGDSFGDLERAAFERIDAPRFYPPDLAPAPVEPGDLPSSYGGNRLVLLAVAPYLIHVYWDLESAAPPAAGVRPILRFHESPASSGLHDDGRQGRPFDVDVDFAASSWYVHLWSSGKIYHADLGWRGEDGSFIQLARSNTVLTPPARSHPAEPVEASAPHPAPNAALPPVDAAPESAPCEIVPDPALRAAVASPRADAFAHLQRKLAELFALRGELPPLHEPVAMPFPMPFEAEEEIPGEPFPPDTPLAPPSSGSRADPKERWSAPQSTYDDLTQLSEERFTPGVSSERGSFGE